MQLDFEIDKLTHSLEDANTGEILATEILPLKKEELKYKMVENLIGKLNFQTLKSKFISWFCRNKKRLFKGWFV